MVSKVNLASRSVTVEWFERGETKGKEVELDAILQLNTEIKQNEQQQQQQQQSAPTRQSIAPANLSRVGCFFCCFKV